MAKKKVNPAASQKQNIISILVLAGIALAAAAGYLIYQKVTFDPYNFDKVKAPQYVETYLANDKRLPAEEITDAALFVAATERDRSPILIGDDDQKVIAKISEMYTQLGLASKADWASAYKAYNPKGMVRPESASMEGDDNILTLGGGKGETKPKAPLGAGADLELLKASGNPDVLVQVAGAYLQRGDKAKAVAVLDGIVKGIADEKDIFVLKRVLSDVVVDYVKAGEADKAMDVYIKNNFFLGAGITLDMMREWAAQKDLNHAFFLFERMLYTPWQKAEALLILAEGYRQSGVAQIDKDHARVIAEMIKDTKNPPKGEKK